MQVAVIGFAQELATYEMLGQLVFKALNENDQTIFSHGLTSESDFIYGMTKIIEQAGDSSIKIPESKVHQILKDYRTKAINSFKRTISDGKLAGIDWSEIFYSKTTYYPRASKEYKELEIGSVYLEIIFDNKTYSIKLGDCLKLKDNWSIEDVILWFTSPNR